MALFVISNFPLSKLALCEASAFAREVRVRGKREIFGWERMREGAEFLFTQTEMRATNSNGVSTMFP
jgi:hypothetical protein